MSYWLTLSSLSSPAHGTQHVAQSPLARLPDLPEGLTGMDWGSGEREVDSEAGLSGVSNTRPAHSCQDSLGLSHLPRQVSAE